MTRLKSLSRFAVALLTLLGVAAAAIPGGWIALRYEPPAVGKTKGHWILVKAPRNGLSAWWSDAELARIVANDPAYVKRLETDWSPVDHPVADPAEAKRLSGALAKYWGGDVPQANYWAHGALTRRGATLRAYRWKEDGPAQRTALEQSGDRPQIPAAAFDPNPVDQRYDNQTDVVTYGDRWGDHLLTATLDHVYTAERNKARRKHHPNPPPAAEILAAAKATVQACREASLKAEMGVFENYVRGWGGLAAKSVSFGLPADCVVNPGPPVVVVNPPTLFTACDGTKHATQAAANAVNCAPPPPRTYTACDGSIHSTQAGANAVRCATNPPKPYTACDGSKHATQAAANAVRCRTNPPKPYTACDGTKHATQAAANAVQCRSNPPRTYTACDGSTHSTQAAANGVNCSPPPPPQQPVTPPTPPSKPVTPPSKPKPVCTIAWLCGNNPDPDPDSGTSNPDNGGGSNQGGGNGGNGGGGGGGNPPLPYTACDGSTHATQADADAVTCTYTACDGKDYDTQAEADTVDCGPIFYTDCKGNTHNSQSNADAVSCSQRYTACDGTEHATQAGADAVDCSHQEQQLILHDLECEGTVNGRTGQCDDINIIP